MHANSVPAALLPLDIGGLPLPGYGFGLGSRVLLDVAQFGRQAQRASSDGPEAKTHYWVDPKEQLVGIFMIALWPLWPARTTKSHPSEASPCRPV
jgi:hypothetical protein